MSDSNMRTNSGHRSSWNRLNVRNRHILLLDVIALSVTPLLALALRLDGFRRIEPYGSVLIAYTATALIVRVLLFRAFGLYSRYWRYASVDDLVQIVASVTASSLAVTVIYGVWIKAGFMQPGVPRSLPILDGLLAL